MDAPRHRCATVVSLCLLLSLPLGAGCRSKSEKQATMLAKMVREGDFESMTKLIDSEDKELRCRAVRTLAWTTHPSARAAHLRIANYEGCDWEDQVDAAWRLWETGADETRGVAVGLLAHRLPEVRWNMAELLGKIEHPRSIPDLEKCTVDPDKFVAAWCHWAICRIQKPDDQCKEPNMDMTNGEPAP